MAKFYTDEVNAQIIIVLLKEHGIRKVVASPGTTNMAFVGSIQNDPYFEVYSSVDERSAAYLACGLSAESGEPVVISCTGATASRNYMSGLTEAFYRKLPILAITSTQATSKVGHHVAQIIDRSSVPNDVVKLSLSLPIVQSDSDIWECEIKVNSAILELKRNGGGPAHLNLPTKYSPNYELKELPKFRVIDRIEADDIFPALPTGKIAIFVGSHREMSSKLTGSIDAFCAANNGVVFCDHTSGYHGKFGVRYALIGCQEEMDRSETKPDLLIHIGEVSGDYYGMKEIGPLVWRLSEDGEIRDTFGRLRYVFEMGEQRFFEHYTRDKSAKESNYFATCQKQLEQVRAKIPEVPFSNIWMASKLAPKIPANSTVHFGILNSLRSWNFFEVPASVRTSSNVGGFGIDGGLSAFIGASLADQNRLYFGVIGDLAFFYDMNVLGNRHVGSNLRILLINNGKGTEFRNYSHPAAHFGPSADEFIAAAGHFGKKSRELVRHYCQDLGFKYLAAENKSEFEKLIPEFVNTERATHPLLLEVFTDSDEESEALEMMMRIEKNMKTGVKNMAKSILGESGLGVLKKLAGK